MAALNYQPGIWIDQNYYGVKAIVNFKVKRFFCVADVKCGVVKNLNHVNLIDAFV